MISGIKWLLFDFGGCLDSDGVHSRAMFFHFFLQEGIVANDEWGLFQDAYTYSDQKVIGESLIKDSSLAEMNRIMCHYINESLERVDQQAVHTVASKITAFQSEYLKRNKNLLLGLSKKFKLGIISNFSGNLEIILKDFDMLPLFDFVLDSYYLGVTKPDAKIFKIALEKCGVDSKEICYMGDNAISDMIPARKLKINTVHLLNLQEARIKTKECKPTATIESLMEIKNLVSP